MAVGIPRIFGSLPLALQQVWFIKDELARLHLAQRPLPWPVPKLASFFHQTMDANDNSSRQCEFDGFHSMLRYPCATPLRLTSQFVRHITSDFSYENALLVSGGFGDAYKQHRSAGSTQVLYSLGGKSVWAEMRQRLLCFDYVPNKSLRQHISDFILSSRLFGENEYRIMTGSHEGTLGYMAPEYANQGLISNKADIFSLGVIIIILEVVTLTHHPRLPAVRGGNTDVRLLASASRSWATSRTTTYLKIAKGVVMMIGVHLILILLNPSISLSRMILTAVGAAAAAVFAQRNPNSPWPWVVMSLQIITAAETLVAVGAVTAFLTLCWLKYFRNLWPWVILVFGIGILATVLDGVEEKLAPGLLMSFRICVNCWLLQFLRVAIPGRIRIQEPDRNELTMRQKKQDQL